MRSLDFFCNHQEYGTEVFNFGLARQEELHDSYKGVSKCFGMLKAKSKRICD